MMNNIYTLNWCPFGFIVNVALSETTILFMVFLLSMLLLILWPFKKISSLSKAATSTCFFVAIVSLIIVCVIGCVDNLLVMFAGLEMLIWVVSHVYFSTKEFDNTLQKQCGSSVYRLGQDFLPRFAVFISLVWIFNMAGGLSLSALASFSNAVNGHDLTIPITVLMLVALYHGLNKFRFNTDEKIFSERCVLQMTLLLSSSTLSLIIMDRLIRATGGIVASGAIVHIPLIVLAIIYAISAIRESNSLNMFIKVVTSYFIVTTVGVFVGIAQYAFVFYIFHIGSLVVLLGVFLLWNYTSIKQRGTVLEKIKMRSDGIIFWMIVVSLMSVVDFPGMGGFFTTVDYLWTLINSKKISDVGLLLVLVVVVCVYIAIAKVVLNKLIIYKDTNVLSEFFTKWKSHKDDILIKMYIGTLLLFIVIAGNSLVLPDFITSRPRVMQSVLLKSSGIDLTFPYGNHLIYIIMVVLFVLVSFIIMVTYYLTHVSNKNTKSDFVFRLVKKLPLSVIDDPYVFWRHYLLSKLENLSILVAKIVKNCVNIVCTKVTSLVEYCGTVCLYAYDFACQRSLAGAILKFLMVVVLVLGYIVICFQEGTA